jgi:uncharacterized protein (DUF2267 family)
MSPLQVEVFGTTLEKSYVWLNDLMAELGWQDPHRAYRALRAVLHTLRDRLTVDEVAQLGAQLPMLLRGLYYEGWNPRHMSSRARHKAAFLGHVEDALAPDGSMDAEEVTRAVFLLLARRVSEGEIADVKETLPADMRQLWP